MKQQDGRPAPEQGQQPSDTEQLPGDTAASAPLTTGTGVQPPESKTREAMDAVPPRHKTPPTPMEP